MEPNIRYKSDYWWLKIFNRHCVTTIFPYIYVPDRSYVMDQSTLRHEMVHLRQQETFGLIPFLLLYSMPIPFAVVSLGAFLAFLDIRFLWLLLSLSFLLPIWPAKYRLDFEIQAYVAGSKSFLHLDETENDTRRIYACISSITYWGATAWYPSQFVLRLIRQEKRRQNL